MRPKVIWFVPHSAVTGSVYAVLEAIDALADRYAFHVVVAAPGDLQNRLVARGVPTTVVESRGWASMHRYPFGSCFRAGRNALSFPAMIRVLARERPALVVTNTLLSPLAAFAANALGIPHLWYFHEFGWEDHGIEFDWGEAHSLRIVGRLSDGVVANSEAVAGKLRLHGLDPRVVYYSVAVDRRPSDPPTSHSLKLVLVGALSPRKGQRDAIQALALLRDIDVSLQLVGSDYLGYRTELEELVGQEKLDHRVSFMGYQTDPLAVVIHCHAALMCSRCEAFGRVTVEAMKIGRPVVAAASGGTIEIVEHEQTGILYRPGDPPALARQIRRLYDDRTLLCELGRRAAEASRARFSMEHYRADLEDAFTAALHSRGGPNL